RRADGLVTRGSGAPRPVRPGFFLSGPHQERSGGTMTQTVSSSEARHAERYSPGDVEAKWRSRWREQGIYEVDLHDDSRPKFYFLTMYPYPSGDLHVGHWYAEAP